MKTLLGTASLAVMAYIGTLLLVTLLDPACGPDGYSQTACIDQFNNDLLAIFR